MLRPECFHVENVFTKAIASECRRYGDHILQTGRNGPSSLVCACSTDCLHLHKLKHGTRDGMDRREFKQTRDSGMII